MRSITYKLSSSLYVSLTNRSNAQSLMRSRGPGFTMPSTSGFALLPDGFEPSAADVVSAVETELDVTAAGGTPFASVVFAGAGEPLLRLRVLEEAATTLAASQRAERLRLNTNGLVPRTQAAETAARLKKARISAVTMAIATADPEQFLELMEPEKLRLSPGFSLQLGHAEVIEFARACLAEELAVEMTAVARPGVDIPRARSLAESLGASFRERSWHPAG